MLNKHRNKTYKPVTKPTTLEQTHVATEKKLEKQTKI